MKKPVIMFHFITIFILILIMKFVWMPHCFFADMSITYMLVRYAYYVVAYILIMLFLQCMLHMSAKKCFHLGIGCLFIRLLIDIFAYILVLCFDLNEWIIIYYFLDAFYLISSGLYVFYGLSVKARKAVSKPFKIIAGISILLLVVLVIMVQSEIIYIAEKYIKDSESYYYAIHGIGIEISFLALLIDLIVAVELFMLLLNSSRIANSKGNGFVQTVLILILIPFFITCKGYLLPDYSISRIFYSGGGAVNYSVDDSKRFITPFWIETSNVRCYRSIGGDNYPLEEQCSGSIMNAEQNVKIEFKPLEPSDFYVVEIEEQKFGILSPYAIMYYQEDEQKILLLNELKDREEDKTLSLLFYDLIKKCDFRLFEYAAEYLLRDDSSMIESYLKRYAEADFNKYEMESMGDIRPDYIQKKAQKFLDEILNTG